MQNAMKKTEQLQVQLEPKLKTEAEAVLAQLGLKPTEFVRMTLRQLIMRRGFQFDRVLANILTILYPDENEKNALALLTTIRR